MRTTLDIDEDILALAKERARLEKKTAGEVISELARRGLRGGSSSDAGGHVRLVDGVPVMPTRGAIITKELVDELERDADCDDDGFASSQR